MPGFARVRSFTDAIMKDLQRSDRRLRQKAGLHVKAQVKAKINKGGTSIPGEPPGKVTGNLLKGLAVKTHPSTTLVGFKAPAYHARMLEFGTSKMAARPVLFPTFAEEAPTVKKILTDGDWLAG